MTHHASVTTIVNGAELFVCLDIIDFPHQQGGGAEGGS
jgi:hypothetical protein